MEDIIKKLGKYKGLKIKKNRIKVEKGEIKKALDYLQNSRAKIITVSRPAKKDDRIEIDFEIRLASRRSEQGGAKVENGESKNHPLILGKGHFIPGFEEKLEGMQAGEKKEFSLKNFDIKVKMNLVQKRELPEINDEFAKSLGQFKNLDELRKSIDEGLFKEKEIKEKQRIKIELIEKIAEDSELNIPDNLINQEKERMFNEFKFNITNMGLDFERYLKEIKKTVEDLKKDWQEQAEKRVKVALCLQEIAERENINVSDSEVTDKKNIDSPALKEYTKNILKNEKVFELLEREAKII